MSNPIELLMPRAIGMNADLIEDTTIVLIRQPFPGRRCRKPFAEDMVLPIFDAASAKPREKLILSAAAPSGLQLITLPSAHERIACPVVVGF